MKEEDLNESLCVAAFPIYLKIMRAISEHLEDEESLGGNTPRGVFLSTMLASDIASKMVLLFLTREEGMPDYWVGAIRDLGDQMSEKLYETYDHNEAHKVFSLFGTPGIGEA